MDEQSAATLGEALKGQEVGGWLVGELLGFGKSAIVCEATRKGHPAAALKIFDQDLIARFGKEAQAARIDRQLSLKGKEHQNLVRILDGGHCSTSGLYFIAMERLGKETLESKIPSLGRDRIRPILKDLVAAARFLDDLGLVHRDIKPSNIAVTPDRGAVLLDLGVIRPHNLSDLTDGTSGRPFLGTLRYSSPEFLIRNEAGDPSGWRALTFYQIAAVLHDMIMREPIFQDHSEPYARLVIAVMSHEPEIIAADVPADLVGLARHGLLKDPQQRLELVTWNSLSEGGQPQEDPLQKLRARIAARQTQQAQSNPTGAETSRRRASTKLLSVANALMAALRQTGLDDGLLPRLILTHEDDNAGLTRDVKLLAPPSEQHSLLSLMTLRFRIELTDPESMIGRVSAAAALGPEPSCDLSGFEVVYSGILDGDAIAPKAREALYAAVAAAAEKGPASKPLALPCTAETEDA